MKKNFQHQHSLEESYQKMIIKKPQQRSRRCCSCSCIHPTVSWTHHWKKKEISKLACAYSKTTNLTGPILLELNQELWEVQVVELQNLTTTDYLLLKEYMGCEQFPGMCCFKLSYFFKLFKFT